MSTRYVYRPGRSLVPVPIGEHLDDELPVIYLFCRREFSYGNRYFGEARAEDGTFLFSQRSSAVTFLKVDLLAPRIFKAHYPGGYQTQWVDEPDTHPGLTRALFRVYERWRNVLTE